MVDFAAFFQKAAELSVLWPSLFNWAVPSFIGFIGIVATATWWMRGYKADADQGELKAQIAGLKGEQDVLTQRLALATEQQKAATEQAKKFEVELNEFKKR